MIRLTAIAALGVSIVIAGAIGLTSLARDGGARDLRHLAAKAADAAAHAARTLEIAAYGAARDLAAVPPNASEDVLAPLLEDRAEAVAAALEPHADKAFGLQLVGAAVFETTADGLAPVLARPASARSLSAEQIERLSAELMDSARRAGSEAAARRGALGELGDGDAAPRELTPMATLVAAPEAALESLAAPQAWLLWPVAGDARVFGFLVAATLETLSHEMPQRAAPATLSVDLREALPAARTPAPRGLGLAAATQPLRHATHAPLGDGWIAITLVAPPRGLLEIDVLGLALPAGLALLAILAMAAFARADRRRHEHMLRRQRAIMKGVAAKQRELEASEERFRRLAECANVVPWTADLDRQQFTYVGPQIEAMSGYSAATWLASGFWAQHIHPNDRQRVMTRAVEQAANGNYATIDYRVRAGDGRILHVRNMLTITRETVGSGGDARRLGTVAHGFLLDVTELKRAAAALEVARRKAEEANRVKSEFLASMSHELRTPLNAVIGFSEIMKEELFGPLDPQYREYAESVHASGRHLLDLINDILDVSKIEAGRIELAEEETDLAELLGECRTLLRERIASAGLHQRFEIADDLPHLMMDSRRIKQVMLNLMSNAIKFTQPGGEISVTARHDPGRGVLMAVRDTGIGMSAEEIPKALSKFGQIDGELARKHEGTGLGLPIAKSLIEMHGGRLEVVSEKGKGTEMRVWLPESRIVTDAA